MLRGLESSLYMAVKAWAAHTHHKPANLIIAITITKYARIIWTVVIMAKPWKLHDQEGGDWLAIN